MPPLRSRNKWCPFQPCWFYERGRGWGWLKKHNLTSRNFYLWKLPLSLPHLFPHATEVLFHHPHLRNINTPGPGCSKVRSHYWQIKQCMSCDLYTSGTWNTIHFWLTQKITLVLNGKKEKERLHLSHPLPTPLLPGWHSALGDHAGFPRTSLEIWLAILFQCCFLIGWKSEIWSAVLFKCCFLIGWEKDAI